MRALVGPPFVVAAPSACAIGKGEGVPAPGRCEAIAGCVAHECQLLQGVLGTPAGSWFGRA